MAEAIFNHLTQTKHATSAACEDYIAKYNGKIDELCASALEEIHVSSLGHHMKLVTRDMARDADYIIVQCDQNTYPAGSTTLKIRFRFIP